MDPTKRINRSTLSGCMPAKWMTLPQIAQHLSVPSDLYGDLCDAVAELVRDGRAKHQRQYGGMYVWSEFRRKS